MDLQRGGNSVAVSAGYSHSMGFTYFWSMVGYEIEGCPGANQNFTAWVRLNGQWYDSNTFQTNCN